jgi:hypothetical protein
VVIASTAAAGVSFAWMRVDEGGHPRRERDVDVHLGEAEVAAVEPHDPKVVGNSKHRARAECVAVDRGDGGHRRDEYAREQLVYLVEVPVTLIAMGGKPIQVKAVRVELTGSGGDQRLRFTRLDAVQEAVDGGQPVRREPVLVVAEVQNRYLIGDFEVSGHLSP